MVLPDRFSTLTTPGDCPLTVAMGIAAKPVELSVATTTLSVKSGRVRVSAFPAESWGTLWEALLTAVTALFEALKTSVFFLLGNSTIMPGVGLVAPMETTLGEIRSSCPSTTFKTGTEPAPAENKGLETKTCTLIVAGFACGGNPRVLLKLLLFPQETRMALAATRSRMESADCLKRGAPKNMRNGELDARNRIIAEPFHRGAQVAHWVRTVRAFPG